jgi:hypothetical protein
VVRAFASSLLSLLLLATLVGGGCISCEQYFMFGGPKGCCSPDGHCKTKTPLSQKSDRECNQIAFDHHKSIDFHIDLPAVVVAKIELPVATVETLEHGALIESSPPGLQILNSTFRI